MILLNYLAILYFVKDDGPMDIFLKFRRYLGVIGAEDINGDYFYESDGSFLADMISCHRCFGFWCGLVIGVLSSLILGLSLSGIIQNTIIIIAGGIYLHE